MVEGNQTLKINTHYMLMATKRFVYFNETFSAPSVTYLLTMDVNNIISGGKVFNFTSNFNLFMCEL